MEQAKLIQNQILEGLRPLEIAIQNKLLLKTVVEEIENAIDSRRIQRSQVLETLDEEWRKQIALYFPATQKPRPLSATLIHQILDESNLDSFDLETEEVRLYLKCFERPFKDGELYELVCEIERTLHTKIKLVLIDEYGESETGWWRKGVSLSIRQNCACLCEEDKSEEVQHPYNYTTLGQLKEILESKAGVFKNRLPFGPNGKPPNMQTLGEELGRFVRIRNRVMHPIGTVRASEDDFFFIRDLQAKLDVTKWRPQPRTS